MQLVRGLVLFVSLTFAATAAADTLPSYPEAKLGDGEEALKGTFASTVEWLGGDGTPVRVRALRKNGKIVLRGYTATTQQDLATSAFDDAELHLFDHENGKTFGLQLHRYVDGKPDLYEGFSVELKANRFTVVKKAKFNGKQPTPTWLYDNVNVPFAKRIVHGIKVLRWAAHRRDANAYGKYFDAGKAKVTWRTGEKTRDEEVAGTDLFAKFGTDFPVVGHNAKCTKLCCTTDSKELAPFVHIAKVCFDADPKDINTFPHVRTIELVQP
jgi:hypothetical protein